jgi:hypothetical protein
LGTQIGVKLLAAAIGLLALAALLSLGRGSPDDRQK